MGALKNTYGEGRVDPLALCAVKTNIGHLEGAAGMAGLLKAGACQVAICCHIQVNSFSSSPAVPQLMEGHVYVAEAPRSTKSALPGASCGTKNRRI